MLVFMLNSPPVVYCLPVLRFKLLSSSCCEFPSHKSSVFGMVLFLSTYSKSDRDYVFCSVFTPYYEEDVMYDMDKLNAENEDGITILFYLQKIYPGGCSRFHSLLMNNT
jgi:hypothetical protein